MTFAVSHNFIDVHCILMFMRENYIQSWTQDMIDTKIMSTLSYDDRSPNPATQIMPL
jgi:hypothetical protein